MATTPAEFDVLLLDIEGTVCPISFVRDVLFPYALDALGGFLDEHWENPSFADYRNTIPVQYRDSRSTFEAHIRDLISRDVKISYLKELQGRLWLQGYKSGQLKAPIYDDVSPFIGAAHDAGVRIMIYSSGSVPAQKLFFSHTTSEPSDLSHLISDWFDTVNAGPKTDGDSYLKIMSRHSDINPHRWLFLSDNLNEVEAARNSGMRSLPVIRPGNAPLPPNHLLSAAAVSTFDSRSIQQALSLALPKQ